MALTKEEIQQIAIVVKEVIKGDGGTSTANISGNETPEQLERLKELNDILREVEEKHKNIVAFGSEEISNARQIIREKQNEISLIEKKIRDGDKLNDIDEENLKTHKENLKTHKEKILEQEKSIRLIKEQNAAAKELGASITSSIKALGTAKAPDVKQFVQGLDAKKIQNFGQGVEGLAKGFKNLNPQMLIAAGLAAVTAAAIEMGKAIFTLAMDLEEAESKFMKATGASQEFASSITDSYGEVRQFGATTEDLSKSFETLYRDFTDFTMLSKNQREELAKTATVLNKLGISNEDFAKSIQISTKALNISAEQAGQNMLDLSKFATELGVPVQKMGQDFAKNQEMVAKLGATGVKSFKDLAIVAKTTGLQMERLLQITNKFDTFEGAAESAGRLNAALGGNFVNAMDLMMTTDPTERFRMIKESLDQAGLSFDTMGYYQKQFIKESMGLNDVSELALVMSGNMDMLDDGLQGTQQSYVDAAKRGQELQSLQESLNTAFMNMIPIITPLVDLLADFGNFVAENADMFKYLGYVLMAVAVSAFLVLLAVFWKVFAVVGLLTAAFSGLAYIFFKKKNSPTFFEGILETAKRFDGLGLSIGKASKEIDAIPTEKNVEFASSIGKVSKEIDAIPTEKNVEFVQSMKAAADVAVKAKVTSGTEGIANMVAGMPAMQPAVAGGGEASAATGGELHTVRQPISIALNGDKMSDFVIEVVGSRIKEINIV